MHALITFFEKGFERLDEKESREFLNYNRFSSLFTIRIILILSLVLNPLWLVFDYYLIPEVLDQTLVTRLVTTFIIAVLLALSFLKRAHLFAA